MRNYKKLTELIPEIVDLIDTGIVTPTTALSVEMNTCSNDISCLKFCNGMDARCQLGRRNFNPMQRIALAEKYRPIYERQAKENMSAGGGDKLSGLTKSSNPVISPISTRQKLAEVAGVSRGYLC